MKEKHSDKRMQKHNEQSQNLNSLNDFIFAADFVEKGPVKQKKLIRLLPYGVSITGDGSRPVLLLKDENSEQFLPVNLNPVEAGMTLMQFNQSLNTSTPHRFVLTLLEQLNAKVEKCVFSDIRGPHQYVKLHVSQFKEFRMRADEVMSFCLTANVKIYATQDFINRSRVMTAELNASQKDMQLTPELQRKKNEYLM